MKRRAQAIIVATIAIAGLIAIAFRWRESSGESRVRRDGRTAELVSTQAADDEVLGSHASSLVTSPATARFFVPDAGTPEELGLIGEPPDPRAVEIPVRERLVVAERATERFAAALARVDAQLATERDLSEADVTRLAARRALLQKRLAIAQLAQHAIRAEVEAAGGRPASSQTDPE